MAICHWYAYLSNLLSHEVGAGGSREAEVMSLLQKDYDFTSDGKRKKTTGFDFIFDTGYFLDNLYTQSAAFADILGDLKLCKYPGVDGYESCMNKVLMKITEGAYSVRIAGNDRTTDAMVRGVLNSDCSFYDAPGRKVPSTCMDYLMFSCGIERVRILQVSRLRSSGSHEKNPAVRSYMHIDRREKNRVVYGRIDACVC